MDVVYERCCGLDVHKRTVVACLLTPGPQGQPQKAVRTFGTMTGDVLALAEWLAAAGCSHVAMEGTGVYWQPIWNLLEDRFVLLLVNARHVKAVPGRKTDVKDAEWLADLLRYGLLAGSFVPDREQRELREVTRYRTALLRERAATANRLQKTLEAANLKLASVVTDITGKSSRAMLRALIAGETEPTRLPALAEGRLREKIPQLEQALVGRFGPHQRFLVAQQLDHLDFLDERIAQISAEVATRTQPLAAAVAQLDAIPGVGQRTAEVLVAEVGTNMARFPTADHLASWAGMCPGNRQSAGRQLSGKTRKGSPWLRAALAEAAQAAGRTKGSSLQAQYRRLAARRGKQRAMVAVGHTILRIAYHLLQDPASVYDERGAHGVTERTRQAIERDLVRRLQQLGNTVVLHPVGAT
jgi:transposase